MDRMTENLDALWAEYRDACPDPEPSAQFMPMLWQKIEARRLETTSLFRHMAQAWVMAALALTLLIVVLLPRLRHEQVYSANTYVEVLDDAHSNDALELLAAGEVE